MELAEHPSEETLIGFALGENGDELRSHVETCAQCAAVVEHTRAITMAVASVEDEDPPVNLREQIIREIKRPSMVSAVQNLVESSLAGYLLAGGVLFMIVILAYILLVLVQG